MGLSVAVPADAACGLPELLERLRAAGLASTVMMLDGQLCAPGAALPATWREVRLRTPAGTVTLARGAGQLTVVVFGNASPELAAAQKTIADALVAAG